MKWVASKNIPEVPGVKFEADALDSSIKSIEVTTDQGVKFKLVHQDYSGIRVYVPAPPAKVKRWRVHGKFLGMVDVCDDFESQHDANDRLAMYTDRLSHGEKSGLVVEQVEVEVSGDESD